MNKPKPVKVMFEHKYPELEKGKMVWKTTVRGPVRIMAQAEGYAMVRRPGCAPFVIKADQILSDDKAKG